MSNLLRAAIVIAIIQGLGFTQANAQRLRYWYDDSCRFRTDATLISNNETNACLELTDGTQITVAVNSFCAADQLYFQAYQISLQAVEHLRKTPYRSGAAELLEVRNQLVDQGLAPKRAIFFTQTQNAYGDRDLASLAGRCVSIHGTTYHVVSAEVSTGVTGIERLVVASHDGTGRQIEITGADASEIMILPFQWPSPSYRARTPSRAPFRHREPPTDSIYPLEIRWKYQLIYDPVSGVWTDRESVQAHQLLSQAEKLWQRSEQLHLIAAARWHVHEGKSQLADGHLSNAIHNFTIAIDRAPEYAEAFLQRGQVYNSLGRNDAALRDFDRAIEFGTSQSERGHRRLHVLVPAFAARSRIRSIRRMHDDAISDAQRAIDLNPDPADGSPAELLRSIRKVAADDALSFAKQMIAALLRGEDPGERAVELALASAERAEAYNPEPTDNTFRDARRECRRLSAKYFAALAAKHFANENFFEAVASASEAVRHNPDTDDKQYENLLAGYKNRLDEFLRDKALDYAALAKTSISEGDFTRAIALARAAEMIAPEEGMRREMRHLLAQSYYFRATKLRFPRSEYDAADQDLTAALALEPTNAAVLIDRGFVRFILRQSNAALADLNEALRIDPNSDNGFFLRAVVHKSQARSYASRSDIDAAIRINPAADVYWHFRSLLNYEEGDNRRSLADVSEAIRLNAGDADYYIHRSGLWLLQDTKDFDRASEDARWAMRLDPHSETAHAAFRQVERRRRSEDPYYVDDSEMGRVALKLVGAFGAGRFTEESAEEFIEAEGFLRQLWAFGKTAVGVKVESKLIESAIDDVFPNLPALDKSVLTSMLSQMLHGKPVLGDVIKDVSKDSICDWIKSERPEWSFGANVGGFLFEVHSAIQNVRGSRDTTGLENPISGITPLAGNSAIDLSSLACAA